MKRAILFGLAAFALAACEQPTDPNATGQAAPAPQFAKPDKPGGGQGGGGKDKDDGPYEAIDIGTLNSDQSIAYDINDAEQVVGQSGTAFIWTEQNGFQDLGTLGGASSAAFAINNLGHVVGSSRIDNNSNVSHAFLWTPQDGMIDLGTLGGSTSIAYDINDQGQVAGSSRFEMNSDKGHAFIWSEGGGMQDLGTLDGAEGSDAFGMSNSGHVVGTTFDDLNHGFIWTQAAGMVDLGTLGGDHSDVLAVNDQGQVVGWSQTFSSGPSHAILWENGVMTDIGTLGGSSSVASDINSLSQAVGRAFIDRRTQHAFLWTQEDGMVDLGTLPRGAFSWAHAINEAGWIVGLTQLKGTYDERATLWKPKQ